MDLVVRRKSYKNNRSVSAHSSIRSAENRLSMIDKNDMEPIQSSNLEFQQKRSLLDLRPLHSFSKDDEYVEAMVEDLCEWLNFLYELQYDCQMNPATFFQQLADGVILNRHAKVVQSLAETYLQTTGNESRALPIRVGCRPIKVPKCPPTWVEVDFSRKINDFHKRDNVTNFITWCRDLNIPIGMTFETEDLVCEKNPRNVVVCLLEIARIGRLFGIEVPDIIQLEEDIDKEVSGVTISTNEINSPTESVSCYSQNGDPTEISDDIKKSIPDMTHITMRKKSNLPRFSFNENSSIDSQRDDSTDALDSSYPSYQRHSNEIFDSNKIDNSDSDSMHSHGSTYKIPSYRTAKPVGRVKIYDCFDQKNLVRDRKYREKCDMRSLDERVREILSECQCSEMFPMKRISEGRYQWGDKKTHIFVRILRNHVMVRVGGGWDTLNNFLRKHDHCRRDKNESYQRNLVAPPIRKFLKPAPVCSNDLKHFSSGISQTNGFLATNKTNSYTRNMVMVSHHQKLMTDEKNNNAESVNFVQHSILRPNSEYKPSENKENSFIHKKDEQTFSFDKYPCLSNHKRNSFIPNNRQLSCQLESDLSPIIAVDTSPEELLKKSDTFIHFSETYPTKTPNHKENPSVETNCQLTQLSDREKYIEDVEILKKSDKEKPSTNPKLNKISRIPVLKKR